MSKRSRARKVEDRNMNASKRDVHPHKLVQNQHLNLRNINAPPLLHHKLYVMISFMCS